MEFVKLVFSSALSVVSMFVITKLLGHKQIAQLDFFDYIIGITIGSIAAELATELEQPWEPLVAVLVYGGVAMLLGFFTRKIPKTRKYINGTPTIIMNNGKLYRQNMKKARLELSEFMMLCRQAGYFDISDIQTAVFEYNGRLTVLPKSQKRPLIPEDIGIATEDSAIGTEVIMDGDIMHDNLKRLGLDSQWLQKHLEAMGYNNSCEIFLGLCDKNHKLVVYPVSE